MGILGIVLSHVKWPPPFPNEKPVLRIWLSRCLVEPKFWAECRGGFEKLARTKC